jgi:hypothetical protein
VSHIDRFLLGAWSMYQGFDIFTEALLFLMAGMDGRAHLDA